MEPAAHPPAPQGSGSPPRPGKVKGHTQGSAELSAGFVAKTRAWGSRLPGFCSFRPNIEYHRSHCHEGVKSPRPGIHHPEPSVNTELVMGGKQCSVRKEGNFLLLGTQGRPPGMAGSLSKSFPAAGTRIFLAYVDAGGRGAIVKTVSTILRAPDLLLARTSGRSRA